MHNWVYHPLLTVDGQVADNLGTEFIITFMRNDVENPQQLPLEIFITTPSTIPVQVEITAPKYVAERISLSTTVVSGVVERVEVSHLLRMTWTGIEGKVLLIQSDSEIVVYGLNKERFSTDGFLAYPTDVIGYEYYTVSHYPTNSNTEFAIAAKYDDTTVSILFPERTRLKIPLRVELGRESYTNGDWLNITLQAYEAFQCVSYDKADLTASYVIADKPVAVFSGNIRTWVGESNSRDHLAVQLPPTQAYGNQFPIIPIPGRTVGDFIKVISPVPNTNIRVENSEVTWYESTSSDFYKSFLIPSENYTTISTDHPVMVVQISQSQQEEAEPGDPTMLVVTSTPQFAADYVFSTPQYSVGGTSLVGTEVQIEEGAHVINHISPVALFSAYIYGTADRESYSFQIGTRLAPINQPCIVTASIFGDGIDNDCDGLIDEELCTAENRGTDTDGDENIDEDCALTRPVAEVTYWPNSDSSKCQLGVIGVHDGTRLDITFPSRDGRGSIDVEFEGVAYTNGDTLTVAINRYSTLQLQSKGRTTGDYFHVIAAENDTVVEVSSRTSVSLNAGKSQTIAARSDEYISFRSNKPILLTQFSQSQKTMNEIGDPTMIVLPSVEQWANAYTFSPTSNSYTGAKNEFYNNYVVMVAPSNRTAGIIFDGQYLAPLFTSWYQIQDTLFSGTSFAISDGVHSIQHEDPTITISVIVYGNADKESYGFAAGMRLADLISPCETTYSVPGDGIDNDCDGRIDEEICEGNQIQTDEDGDGRFNEDCAVSLTPPPLPSTTLPSTTVSTTTVSTTTVSTTTRAPITVVGPPGPPGNPGAEGIPGPQGAPGLNGIPGQPGVNGQSGEDGAPGETGATGSTGARGEVGNTGMTGSTGLTGATGIIGPQGAVGATGSTGTKGEQGISVEGDKGSQGATGATGQSGTTGAKGEHGVTGDQGSTGATGVSGVTGAKGESGSKGEPGEGYRDINECEESHLCSDGCVNTIGSYYCTCLGGYELDESEKQCQDVDECTTNNGGCADVCINTVGSFTCLCNQAGYHLSKDMRTCVDDDECAPENNSCGENQMCINSVGSFLCMNLTEPSTTGYSSTPKLVLTGCAVNNGGCTDACYETDDGFYCSCQKSGYMLANNAQTCIDIDECQVGNNDCARDTQMCVNSLGSFYCINITTSVSGVNVPPTPQASRVTEGLVNGDLILAILIWLCIVSFLLLPLLILVLVQHYRHRDIKEDYTNNLNDLYRRMDDYTPSPSPKLHERNVGDFSSIASSAAPSISYA
ncbi:uncharacterized protein [Watersipora subatra]|uniref:uncharacterized protein n=1 Tax=Watersipora subatra TaxID=2589382 RepID=UPI00355C1FF2